LINLIKHQNGNTDKQLVSELINNIKSLLSKTINFYKKRLKIQEIEKFNCGFYDSDKREIEMNNLPESG